MSGNGWGVKNRGMGFSLAMPHPWPNIAVEPTPNGVRSSVA